MIRIKIISLLLIVVILFFQQVRSQDWPQWRYDANRSASSTEELPSALKIIWSRSFGKRKQVWDDVLNLDLMPYDKIFEPIVVGDKIIFGFNDRDMLIALNAKTGSEEWRYYVSGPIRFPPSSWKGKVFVASDDGYLYCINIGTGKLVWKFRGGPSERKVLGNDRIISSWPARGGPVVRDDKVYFAASIWPFMGTFIYCLDADTGKMIWVNDGTSALYIKQPHNAPSFAGVGPQGALVATKNYLLVPGGRSIPAGFDRKTGKMLYFPLGKSGKGVGGSFVVSGEKKFYVHTRGTGVLQYDLKSGNKGAYYINEPVIGSKMLFTWKKDKISEKIELIATSLKDLSADLFTPYGALDRSKWKSIYTNSHHRRHEGNRAFDGNMRTMWHTYWNKGAPKHPHELIIDLGKSYAINGVVCQPRVTKEDGMIKDYEIFLSSNPKQWGKPLAKGSFNKTRLAQQVDFATSNGRYLKIRALSAQYGDIYTTLVEIFALDANRKPKPKKTRGLDETPWKIKIQSSANDMIQAGSRLYLGGSNGIVAYNLPKEKSAASKAWSLPVKGDVKRLLAANGFLYAITLEGDIIAFGPSEETVANPIAVRKTLTLPADEISEGEISKILEKCEVDSGYALCFGMPEEKILNALIKKSKFELNIIIDDAKKVKTLRHQYDQAGFYGKRIVISQATVSSFKAPSYIAPLVIVNKDVITVGNARNVLVQAYRSVRPYGGVLWLRSSSVSVASVKKIIVEGLLPKADVKKFGASILITRVGALLGSADWTHQYGDIANSVKSDDTRVKLPLGILWFGGVSNSDVLPRHSHGPPEQVVSGRLFIEGHNEISARDVYTGRMLWNRTFKDLGVAGLYWDKTYEDTPLSTKYNQVHIPGANVRGTNFVATKNVLYLVKGPACILLNTTNGKTIKSITMPKGNSKKGTDWGYIGVYKNLLIGGQGFALFSEITGEEATGFNTWRRTLGYSASRGLVIFDRESGQELWRVSAKHSFIHNGIIAGDDKIFCLDRLPSSIETVMKARKKVDISTYRIVAYEAKTGKKIWETNNDIFGTWLSLSEKHKILIQAGARASDRGRFEIGKGITAFKVNDGKVLWRNKNRNYTGPLIVHNDLLITSTNSYGRSRGAFNLLDGKPYYISNHITGDKEELKFSRAYGCNTPIASEHLLTFRSGAAGFYDLENKSGTGNFGGFKSGCTSNLVVANGVLNAPDYTRTCSCSYQNQTSLALIHMPDLELWTNSLLGKEQENPGRIRRLGVNLGAPGDRLSKKGTLWLEYPIVGGDSPDLKIKITGAGHDYFRSHALRSVDNLLPWASASGVLNIESLKISLSTSAKEMGLGAVLKLGSDDSEEFLTGKSAGIVSVKSSDLEMAFDNADQIVALRFQNIKISKEIPYGETNIQFTVDEVSHSAAILQIYAEATDNSKPIEIIKKNISNRIKTKKFITWKPKNWVKVGNSGPAQLTPDLKPLLDEITSRPGWKAGNSICFLIVGKGSRVAMSSEKTVGSTKLNIQDGGDEGDDSKSKKRKFSVSLLFRDPDNLPIGDRVFDVLLQGKVVLKDFDIAKSAKIKGGAVFKEFKGISVSENLLLEFKKAPNSKAKPVLCGFELIEEK